MAAAVDEFEEYRMRATPGDTARPATLSRDDCLHFQDNISRIQDKMRMRASFKSDSTYRSRRRQHLDHEILDKKLAHMKINSEGRLHSPTNKHHGVDYIDDKDIDCDFPTRDDVEPRIRTPPARKSNIHSPCITPTAGTPTRSPSLHRAIMAASPSSHHRSRSCRVRPNLCQDQQFQPSEEPRKRTFSMPSRSKYRRPRGQQNVEDGNMSPQDTAVGCQAENGDDKYYRVRTFSSSSKGFVNRGDSIKRKKSLSAQSSLEGSRTDVFRPRVPSTTSQDSSVGSTESMVTDRLSHVVLIMGSNGVGKSSLLRQFMSSEDMGNTDTKAGKDEDQVWNVSVMLDEVEATLEFSNLSDPEELTPDCAADAFVVVYALNDRDSFDEAVMCLHVLRKKELLDKKATILVANKGDIVRGRDIEEQEGKIMAVRYGCKYVEVSAILNLKVDELLVGILKQIRLNDKRTVKAEKKKSKSSSKRTSRLIPDNGCIPQPMQLVGKIFGKHPHVFRSCDNLLIL